MTAVRDPFRLAEGLLKRTTTATPRVVWCGLNQTPKKFAEMLASWAPPAGARLLAVLPHGHGAKLPAYAEAVLLPPKCFKALHPQHRVRHRALYGGRGAGAKSVSVATVLILHALTKPIRVLCAREFMKSIAESSHKLLTMRIDELKLGPYFDVKNTSITSTAGGEFIFEGLFANISKIKSLVGVSICWVEEAATISANSWEVLEPTIRDADSAIWSVFNPQSETDPTYRRYVVSPPPRSIVVKLTCEDNPWFPQALQEHREYLLKVDPDACAHIFGGEPKQQSEAQIFKNKFVIEPFTPAQGWTGPYYGSDFGFSADPSTLVKCWVADKKLYVEYEAYGMRVDTDRLPELFATVPGAVGTAIIRADSARPETISYLKRHGYPEMRGVEKWPNSIEEGIRFLRSFEQIVVHPRCIHTAEEMRLYSFKVDRLTGDVLTDIVDRSNHCIDAIRYALAPLIKVGGGFGIFQWFQQQQGAQQAAKVPHDKQPGAVLTELRTRTGGWNLP
jgi:phage terminase large subunit